MQIDFHHGVTYVVARLAGFSPNEAEIIAYSAQYVDDATASGEIHFTNQMMYGRISSAHQLLDTRNIWPASNHSVWLPFHFLPSNDGQHKQTIQETALLHESHDDFIRRAICRPDSCVAQEMIAAVIERQDRDYALHRLGIALHVYVDTWAHQGFVGFAHRVNDVDELRADVTVSKSWRRKSGKHTRKVRNWLLGWLLGDLFPLGHGAALTCPDLPYLQWSYLNGQGEHIQRDNPQDFSAAARAMYCAMVRYRARDTALVVVPPTQVFARIDYHLRNTRYLDGNVRHRHWLKLIGSGEFGFVASPSYIPHGVGSWKHQALQTERDDMSAWMESQSCFEFHPVFMMSNWKRFHDALQAHRFYVLNELLPSYGICAA